MLLITEFVAIIPAYNIYKIFEVDTGTYYCSPKNKSAPYWMNDSPEFFITKIKGRWVAECDSTTCKYVSESLIQNAGKAIDDYLFEVRFKQRSNSK